MSITLKKGQKLNLSKEAAGHRLFVVGLGWDPNDGTGAEFDLDASAFLCKYVGGKPTVLDDPDPSTKSFVFYNQPVSACGGVWSTGDNRTGGGDGDDEQIIVDLAKIDPACEEVAIIVTIDEYVSRRQNFGQVRNAYIRVCTGTLQSDGAVSVDTEITRFDLTEDFSIESAVQFGSLYKNNGEWKFNAIGKGFENYGLSEFVHYFAPHVAIEGE
jgi:tellurium resistance protein TerD